MNFITSVYTALLDGSLSTWIFQHVFVDGARIIEQNFLMIYILAKIWVWVAKHTQSKLDDELSQGFINWLTNFRNKGIKVEKVEEVEEAIEKVEPFTVSLKDIFEKPKV